MIQYRTNHMSSGKRDGFAEVLAEAKAAFEESNINILGEGYAEIVSDDGLFEDYKAAMLRGVDADEVEALGQLMDNSRLTTLQEALNGITPIQSLSIPTIRKLWPRISLKNVIPTEAVKLPKFTVSYMLPYILRDGQRYYLPEALMPGGTGTGLAQGHPLYQGSIELDDFTPVGAGAPVDGARKGFKLLETLPDGVVASANLGDSIDPDFWITEIVVETAKIGGGTEDTPITNLRVQCGIHGDLFFQVDVYSASDLNADGTPKVGAVKTQDMLFGRLDRVKSVMFLTSTNGSVKSVKIHGRLSPEFNNRSESVSFEITNRDITIGTGTHINAPLPIEFLQDVMAMYNIDGAAKVVDIMTNVIALKLDYEIRDFITDAWTRSPVFNAIFDCKPSSQFNGTPKEWRAMIQDAFDYQAMLLKERNLFSGGKFVIVGNPRDIALIPNVSWSFTGTTTERSGVEVDYSIGAVSGENRYDILGTVSIPAGYIYMFYVSTQDEQLTYKYFPYTFNVEKGYRDPNFPNVPSIMMAKRHKLEVFKDAIVRVEVRNNSGQYHTF